MIEDKVSHYAKQLQVQGNFQDECNRLGDKAFSIIELVEVAGVPKSSFDIIRKKLLDLGNDVKRLPEKVGE